jgi:acyl-CoA dehydrogenase
VSESDGAGGGLIVDITTRILRDLAEPQALNNARDDAWRRPLWQALEENGLTRAWVPEALGGAGLSLADSFAILRVAGRFALPVPLAETMLAAWLLAKAGLQAPAGPLTVAPVRPRDGFRRGRDGRLDGKALGVPFARAAGHVVVAAADEGGVHVALVSTDGLALRAGHNLASEPKDDLVLAGAVPAAEGKAEGLDADSLLFMGATARAAQMAGALEAILDISVRYAGERVAFGRPIGKFQAVQHNLAQLASETAAAVSASGTAARALDRGKAAPFLDVAAAKIRVGEAAGAGAAIAHQTHGAIGFTIEHVLHRYTHRLWSWRDEFGDESYWAVRLGQAVAAEGADTLWPTITAA